MSTNKRKQKNTIKSNHEKNGSFNQVLIEGQNISGYLKYPISYCYLEEPQNLKSCIQCPNFTLRAV